MASEKLLQELNNQFNFELLSGHYYMAMAAYCASEDLEGFENFFIVQGQEEYQHAMRFIHIINEMDGRVKMLAIEEPNNDYESLVDVFEQALHHEKLVTSRINNLMSMAKEENCYATINFLQWFIAEQLEEESSMKTIITSLKRIGENYAGIYMLDKELSTRTLPPVQE